MGQEEQQQLLAPDPAREPDQEAAKNNMPGADTAAAAALCDFCGGLPAVVYCRADSARLCAPCDRQVHGANAVSSRHARAPLCAACRRAPAAFRRAARFLCGDCDFDRHGGAQRGEPLHDRAAVEGYTGCPSVQELAAALGVGEFEKAAAAAAAAEEEAAADGWWWRGWEEPQVLSLEDLIVPTTSCHGFHPLLMPSSPKNRGSPCGELNEEVLRQLGELARSESAGAAPPPPQGAAYEEAAEQATEQMPSWEPSEYALGHGCFGTEDNHEAATMVAPASEYVKWDTSDGHGPMDACKPESAYERVPVASAEASLSSFVEMSDICPTMNHPTGSDDCRRDPALTGGGGPPVQALPRRGGYDVACPDRDSVISRYKEKRKTRRYEKQIRYESRKVRADSRLRIKGRFAKADQMNHL